MDSAAKAKEIASENSYVDKIKDLKERRKRAQTAIMDKVDQVREKNELKQSKLNLSLMRSKEK